MKALKILFAVMLVSAMAIGCSRSRPRRPMMQQPYGGGGAMMAPSAPGGSMSAPGGSMSAPPMSGSSARGMSGGGGSYSPMEGS